MTAAESPPQPTADSRWGLVQLLEIALATQSLEEFAQDALPAVAQMAQSALAVLYSADTRLSAPVFFQHGLPTAAVPEMEMLCAEQFRLLSSEPEPQPTGVSASSVGRMGVELSLFPLRAAETCVGLLGLEVDKDLELAASVVWQKLLSALASAIGLLIERAELERRQLHLNTYLTVSSMLTQPLDLHELLETALYCCMEVVSAEAASILLLDEEKANFQFYQVEGHAKPVLAEATFPADKGLAGSVLESQQSEVINDVRGDPRFYEQIDSETGFQTRNMIVIPLVAGEEKIGVLEVLNKASGDGFTNDEHLSLVSIAEELAFAIRNATVFEYVVNTYCKQRQGQMSCKGCQRPLGSWTPCVKYREVGI
jgi:GAF domain-containing protein